MKPVEIYQEVLGPFEFSEFDKESLTKIFEGISGFFNAKEIYFMLSKRDINFERRVISEVRCDNISQALEFFPKSFNHLAFSCPYSETRAKATVLMVLFQPSNYMHISYKGEAPNFDILDAYMKRNFGSLPPFKSKVKKKEKMETPCVFIGHGHDSQWGKLYSYLYNELGLQVKVYESGPRAGLSTKEVLEELKENCNIAFLVHTGENIGTDSRQHARENVIHEAGLFQGKRGFRRAIVVLENGCAEYSNIVGINQIRFKRDHITDIFPEVLETIKREFSEFIPRPLKENEIALNNIRPYNYPEHDILG